MRILHLEASPGWGGQEIRILQEAQGMRERGHTLFFAVMRGGSLVEYARAAGFKVYPLNFHKKGWIFTLIQLVHIIRKEGIQIINTHSSLDSWIGGIAARIAKKKIVRTRHLSTPVKPGWNSRLLYKTLADFVVTTCEAIIPPLSKQSGRSIQFFKSIATGVDAKKIQMSDHEISRYRNVMDADFLVGTACFMRSWKGIEDFLKAADILRKEDGIKWMIIGGGHAERYLQLAKEMNLLDIVYFTGHLVNPIPALAALDAFALLSTKHEGVSQAILQAGFLKKPLISTSTGGLAEVCLDRETGILVPPFQPQKVADAVLELKGNRSLCKSLGERARSLIEERFTFKRTLDGMEECYRNVLSRN